MTLNRTYYFVHTHWQVLLKGHNGGGGPLCTVKMMHQAAVEHN